MVAVGQVLGGKYKLLRLLGDGGMGSVYEAEHHVLGTRVAVKVLHSELARKPGLIDRFLQEAKVSAQIRSTHVVHVSDVERTPDGVAYLVMELLQGEPLSAVEKREGKLTVGTATEYTIQILQALEAAHALGVVHRDLKPDNVFVTFEGGKPVLKLIDFGIAKLKRTPAEEAAGNGKALTVAGMLMGTPEYMAPEQAYSADKVDVRADIYSVGVMLYEMLSGQTPAQGVDPRIVVAKVERGEVTPLVHAAPGTRPEVAGLVHRAMAPRAELRFASATEMRLAIEAVMSGKKAPATAQVQAKEAPAEPAASPANQEQKGSTVMGAPIAGALAPPPPMHRPVPPQPAPPRMAAPPPRQHKRGGNGILIALAIIALLLGAGAVVAYVMSTMPVEPVPPLPEPTPQVTIATTTSPQLPPTPPPGPATNVAPLTPPVNPPPQPQPSTKPSGNPRPEPAPSGSIPQIQPIVLPSGFPTTLPPFPSTLPPFPSGLQIPGWPPAPPAQH